jgi:aryl-phospho-beta-D-glucosidase BglC (GH1 family)
MKPGYTSFLFAYTMLVYVAHGDHWLKGLQVVGNKLLNGKNEPVSIHGINRSGAEYMCSKGFGIFDGPYDMESLRIIKSWNVNVIRIPLNEACWLNVNAPFPQYSGTAYRAAINSYVTDILSLDMGVILDLHWTAGNSPTLPLLATLYFFSLTLHSLGSL